MPDHVTVLLLDTATGARAISDDQIPWYWTDGNGSCDCNRGMPFGHDLHPGECLGCTRYLVLAVDGRAAPPDYNRGYPAALLGKHLPQHSPICPYCGSNSFRNAWGDGNAVCSLCEREFVVTPVGDGRMSGTRLDGGESMLFHRWLKGQQQRQDAIGELARWFKGLTRGAGADRNNDPAYYIACLNKKGPYNGAMQALHSAWTEYITTLFRRHKVDTNEPVIEYWAAHYIQMIEGEQGPPSGLCSLCGNTGIVDTSGVKSRSGYAAGRRNFCICPNGQMLRQEVGPDVPE